MSGYTGYGEGWAGNSYSVITQSEMLDSLKVSGADGDFVVTLDPASIKWHE